MHMPRALPPTQAPVEEIVELTGDNDEPTAIPITYHTNTLGLFNNERQPLHAELQPTLSDAFGAFGTYEAAPRKPLELEAPLVQGGWTRDAMGRDFYASHGVIEEVEDEEASLNGSQDFVARLHALALAQLPDTATPPPAPIPRVMDLYNSYVGDSSSSGGGGAYSGSSPQPTELSMPSTPGQNAALFMHGALLHQDLDTLRDTLHELRVMTLCLAENHPKEEHYLKTCDRMEDTIVGLVFDLDNMLAITEEQWRSATSRVQTKLSDRLHSLHRTLGRLNAVVQQPLKYSRIRIMLTKLEEHVEKMANLATGLREILTHVLQRSAYFSFRNKKSNNTQKLTESYSSLTSKIHMHHPRPMFQLYGVQRHRDRLRFLSKADW